jgi:hypothetical protein
MKFSTGTGLGVHCGHADEASGTDADPEPGVAAQVLHYQLSVVSRNDSPSRLKTTGTV